MGTVTILNETTKNPITIMGERAGVCWGTDISNPQNNYKRGLECIQSGHGRMAEFVNVEMVIDGYSVRVIREWYTHIGGAPTRLQESTRYINYNNFNYIIPPSILNDAYRVKIYHDTMSNIMNGYKQLLDLNVPKEDVKDIVLHPIDLTIETE